MRLPFGRSSLVAAAAIAGAIVYWRANERRRSHDSAEMDEAIAEGRRAGRQLGEAGMGEGESFDQP